jgi:hypothetical protein
MYVLPSVVGIGVGGFHAALTESNVHDGYGFGGTNASSSLL